MTKILLFLFSILASACIHQSRVATQIGYPRFGEVEFGGRFVGFAMSPIETLIVEIDEPIVVPKVYGVLRSAGGEWPQDVQVLFEIRGPLPSTRVTGVFADRKGRFSFGNVPFGTYSFKATVAGWQSVVGTIIVSKSAARKKVDLTLPLGV